MTLQQKLDFILENTPWNLSQIAEKVSCHVNTIKKVRSGGGVLPIYEGKILELYETAVKIKKLADKA